ncbi:DUF3995 domain-containing protein [Acetobacteraceae bacterium ESL0709]|nr:DUF3995 domain-containing protein [Acetobacteraceae bacterium ESL0697]MDF7678594.1 DUF3995 domain-containing protein [Acetobacteraceae bacterium ESL0709]
MIRPLISAIFGSLELFFLLSFFIHLYWGLGGKGLVMYALPVKADGEYYFRPGKIALFMIPFLSMALFLIFIMFDSIESKFRYAHFLFLILGIMFVVRAIGDFRSCGFFKHKVSSIFWLYDTYLYTPGAVLVAVMQFILFAHYSHIAL